MLLLCAGMTVLAGCAPSHHEAEAPDFVRHGQELTIPAGSPLRKRLVIAAVEVRAAPHLLPVPASVEADPAHVANVLPALAGRVSALKVDLGDHVKRSQLLAVIDSGAMAQAYAAVATTRDTLQLARKTLARARGVQQAGGAAVKDVEAAQSAYTQATAA